MSKRRKNASDENNTVFNDINPASKSLRLQADKDARNTNILGVTSHNNKQPNSEQQAPHDAALTMANRQKRRRKWTNEINESLLRAYYEVTESEIDMTGYRTKLHRLFTAKHPDYNVTEQRLSDQVRVIHRNNLISEGRRGEIKREVGTDVGISETRRTGGINGEEDNPVFRENESSVNDVNSGNNNAPKCDDENSLKDEIRDKFLYFYSLYDKSNPIDRPRIPKINTSKKACRIIELLNNNIIPPFVQASEDLETLQTIVYCAALTTGSILGKKICIDQPQRQTQQVFKVKKKWLDRIDAKIKDLRSHISSLNEYIGGNNSRRLKNRVKKIFKVHNRHSRFESNDSFPFRVLDTLKQKLSLQSRKREKYLTSERRKVNNMTFNNNEKSFYRDLRTHIVNSNDEMLTVECIEQYWSSIWSAGTNHDNAEWIENERTNHANIPVMDFQCITEQNLQQVIQRAHNWKAPGLDKVQNFWYKRFSTVHSKLSKLFTECLLHPHIFPTTLTQGITYLLPKRGSFQGDPANGRPITCLPTLYKLLTACINNLIYQHLEKNNIIAEEQKGCIKGAKGCKEQLTIDQVILEQASKNSRNLNAGYIDYQKAFDSLPHSWLIEILRIYKVSPTVISFLEAIMKHWKTTIQVSNNNITHRTNTIRISKGIYQGDCLSALWFCIALNPLSNMLNRTKHGFSIRSEK